MNKAKLREIFKNKRKELKINLLEEYSLKINKKIIEFIEENEIKNIHCYLTKPDLKEVQTHEIINYLWAKNINVISTISNPKNFTLQHFYLTPNTVIKQNQWGIPEPQNALEAKISEIELVITPLLCFDFQGYRVGYGKGFYDRFFAQCNADIIKIGLSIDEPVEEIEDINEYDFPLDFVFTPDNFYAF
jgi:5-formyltetrahydrofolate cyclo-ligase